MYSIVNVLILFRLLCAFAEFGQRQGARYCYFDNVHHNCGIGGLCDPNQGGKVCECTSQCAWHKLHRVAVQIDHVYSGLHQQYPGAAHELLGSNACNRGLRKRRQCAVGVYGCICSTHSAVDVEADARGVGGCFIHSDALRN